MDAEEKQHFGIESPPEGEFGLVDLAVAILRRRVLVSSVFVVCLAHGLDRWTHLEFVPAALLLAAVLVIPGLAVVGYAVGVFRRDFRGMQNSLAEFREDLVWLKEWAGQVDNDADRTT